MHARSPTRSPLQHAANKGFPEDHPVEALTFHLHREVLPLCAHAAAVDSTVQGLRPAHGQGVGVPQAGHLMPLAAANLHTIFEPRHRGHGGRGQSGCQDDVLVFPDHQQFPASGFLWGRGLKLRLWAGG